MEEGGFDRLPPVFMILYKWGVQLCVTDGQRNPKDGGVMKIGIYGGTFDPIHIGHLILAESVREDLELDEVWFVPAFLNPHKAGRASTPPKFRLEMLRFAIAGHPNFKLSEIEIRRKGPSFTCETLQSIHHERPADELFLMIGADSLTDFPNWREPDRILELSTVVAVNRGREAAVIPQEVSRERIQIVNMPAIEVSATEIRNRIREAKSIRYFTPRAVELFIQANSLYAEADQSAT